MLVSMRYGIATGRAEMSLLQAIRLRPEERLKRRFQGGTSGGMPVVPTIYMPEYN